MVEIVNGRCFVLWLMNHRGKVSHEPTVFTTAAAAISQGEKLKDKDIIKDYNYSVVSCPQINGEPVSAVKSPILNDLTSSQRPATIQL